MYRRRVHRQYQVRGHGLLDPIDEGLAQSKPQPATDDHGFDIE